LLPSDAECPRCVLEASGNAHLIKPTARRNNDRARQKVGRHVTQGEYEMVRTTNTAGHAAIAMVINLVLVAGVFAGMAAAIAPLVA